MVPNGKPGIYYLGEVQENKFFVLYVGRSDTCLKTRLLQHVKKGIYHFFRFRMCRTKKSAFKNECYMYHTYNDAHNKIHPAHNGECDCPVCKTAEQMQTLLPSFSA